MAEQPGDPPVPASEGEQGPGSLEDPPAVTRRANRSDSTISSPAEIGEHGRRISGDVPGMSRAFTVTGGNDAQIAAGSGRMSRAFTVTEGNDAQIAAGSGLDGGGSEAPSTKTGPKLRKGLMAHLASVSAFASAGQEKQQRVAKAKQEQDHENEENSKHEKSNTTCEEMLQDLHNPETAEHLEEHFENLFWYKETWLGGTLLHYAIWKSSNMKEKDAALVRSVLQAKAEVRSKASYKKRGKTNSLEAVHLASGLGSVPTLKALVEESKDPVDIVNADCFLDGEYFYKPIHDAAFNGRKDTLVWLLENRADPCAVNKDHKSALSFLALNGLDNEADLETMVRSLLKHGARLDQRTKDSLGDVHGGKLCLELAAGDDSQYPRRLLHLLAPSFQVSEHPSETSEHFSVFDDLCVLAGLNMDAANQLAKELTNNIQRVLQDSQKENAVDNVAKLFHMAPEAAADLLGIMMRRPAVQDPGHHPIPARTALWGFFKAKQMRCAYQPDVKERNNPNDLMMPQWKFDGRKHDDQQPEIQWHHRLVPMPGKQEERREYIDDVETKVVLLPNILDIDLFMALACTGDDSSGIFGRLAVQGIITCLWDKLMTPVVRTRLLLILIDVAVQAVWGLCDYPSTEKHEDVNSPEKHEDVNSPEKHEDVNSPVQWPLMFSLVTAGLLRDAIHLYLWMSSHYKKWRGHYKTFTQWERDRKSQRPPGLHSLWSPKTFFSNSKRALLDVVIVVIKATFVWMVSGQRGRAMTDTEQALLTTCTIAQVFKLIYILRLTSFGRQVTTIIAAFCSSAILEMMFVTGMFVGCIRLSLAMLRSTRIEHSAGLYLYRGLLFGDGDALDYMGLDPKASTESTMWFLSVSMRSLLMLTATLLFNIVILNLTTAVYTSEYDRLQSVEEQHFFRERSKYCTELLLSGRRLPFRLPFCAGPDTTADATCETGAEATADASGMAGIKETADASGKVGAEVTADATGDMVWQIGVALAVALAIFCADPAGSTGSMDLRIAWLVRLAPGFLVAFAMVNWQAYLLMSPWFPQRNTDREGPEKEHFLWICHRAKLKEDQAVEAGQHEVVVERLGRLEQSLDEQMAKLDLGRVEENVNEQLAKLEKKVEDLGTHVSSVDTKLTSMAESLAELLRRTA